MRFHYSGISLTLICALATLCTTQVLAAHNVGFRTLGQWTESTDRQLTVNVWYPSTSATCKLNYAPWTIPAAQEGNPAQGRFPLLLLSHASTATRFSYHDTAAFLASSGFVVAAPNHDADNLNNMDDLFTDRQLESRVATLSSTITLLLENADTAPSIDANRIGVFGFGSGAAAVLLLGGALPDCGSWKTYCAKAGEQDIHCTGWVKSRLNSLCMGLPLTKSLADNRVGAIAAVAPGFGMLFGPDSFRYFYPPLLLIAAGNDHVNTPAMHAEAIYRLMGKNPSWIVLDKADPGALTAPCPEPLNTDLPELCRSVTDRERHAIHQDLRTALNNFFLQYLGRADNPPVIPPPPKPDAATPAVPAPQQQRKQLSSER
ncbi:MAG: conserved hypothetical protein [Candidatus Desulfovibrio kirbyi]|uniref:Dienelactone hydrolase n=1 Tax=Candidatus Desulfovibrio kirbyi TaxID=2696086 RepID=A0A6L2R6Z4_9BACT|nr:MAG: conserved hypothetical protein [Candidatus Desulfovibrio kirbyi]